MATIIRKDNVRESHSGPSIQPIAFSFGDMRGRAGDYLETVRGEAAKIVQEAHQQAEKIRRQAEAAGRKAGESAVDRMLEEKIAKRMETLLPALERTAAQLDDAKGELLRQWERSAVRVATAMAARIIRRELARQPEIALDIIAEALRLATGTGQITLHVNPTDYEHLGKQIERLAETLGHIAPAHIVADAEVSPGGCRVTTTFGEIDQQIEAQLRRIEEDLE
ncbi:MAG: FliH/SctL family protein [Pirellulales bacterium]